MCARKFILGATLVLCSSVHAQVTADPTAPGFQPTIVVGTGADRTVIAIRNPSASGVSHNKYSDFNVPVAGLILNNSTTAGTSFLGQSVSANSNFTGAAALVILNEVTSANSSSLLGETEVYGSGADLIIANPNGITVNGGTFRNVRNVTLSTGTPTVSGANVALGVSRGGLVFSGSGANASNVQRLALSAKRINVEAPISGSDDLDISVGEGTQTVNATSDTSAWSPSGTGTATGYSFDATALGAMTAGQIRVAVTDAGAGVRARGDLAATTSDLRLDARGNIVMAKASAARDLRTRSSQGSLTTTAKQNAARDIVLNAATGLSSKDLDAGRNLNLSTSTGLPASPIRLEITGIASALGAIDLSADEIDSRALTTAGGNLTYTALRTISTTALTQSGGDMLLTGSTLTMDGSLISTGNLTLTATGTITLNSGTTAGQIYTLTTPGDVTVNALARGTGGVVWSARNLTTTAALNSGLGAVYLNLSGDGLFNAQVDAATDITLTAVRVANRSALSALRDFSLNANSLDTRSGTIRASRDLTMNVTGTTLTQGGYLRSGRALSLTSASLNQSTPLATASNPLAGGIIDSSGGLTITLSGDLQNTRGIIAATGNSSINLPGTFTNDFGYLLVENGDLNIRADTALINTAGTIQSLGTGSDITLRTKRLENKRGPVSTVFPGGPSVVQFDTTPPAILSADGRMDIILDDLATAALNDGSGLNNASILFGGDSLSITGKDFSNEANYLRREIWEQRRSGGFLGFGRRRSWVLVSNSPLYSGADLQSAGAVNINLSGTFTNTALVQSNGTATINALGGITNGLQFRTLITPAPRVPPRRITLGFESLPDPADALFKVSRDPASRYVVNSLISLGSDLTPEALLIALGLDPTLPDLRFLADPLFESRLLRQQALETRGSSFFFDDVRSDREQRQRLYANAVAFAQANPSIRFGEVISPELLTTLGSPLLWYVQAGALAYERALSTWQALASPKPARPLRSAFTDKTLLAQVYLPSTQTALLAGGQIMANDLTLTTANTLRNTGYLTARNDLTATAGDVINERRTAVNYENVRVRGLFGSSSKAVAYEQIQAGGEMTAGRNMTLTATNTASSSSPSATGTFTNRGGLIAAGQNMNISSTGSLLNEGQRSQTVNSWNPGQIGAFLGKSSFALGTEFTPAQLLAGDNLTLSSGTSIRNVGSSIRAGNDITLTAPELIEQDIQYASNKIYDGVKLQGFSLSSSTRSAVVTARSDITSLNGDVNISVGSLLFLSSSSSLGTFTNRGSTVAAGQNVDIRATGDATFSSQTVSVENTSQALGFTGTGFTYSQAAWNETRTEQSAIQAGNNINLTASNNVTGTGLTLDAGNDIRVQAGNDITMTAEQVNRYNNSSGWGVGVSFLGSGIIHAAFTGGDIGQAALQTVPGASAIQSLLRSEGPMDTLANGTQLGMEAWGAANSAASAINQGGGVGGAVGSMTGATNGTGALKVEVAINVDQWQSQQNWTESYRSGINAGGNISLLANQDINLRGGTDALAAGNVILTAGRDVVVEALKDTRSTDASNAGASFGVAADVSGGVGMGFTVSGRYGQSQSDGTNYTYGNLQAGDALTVNSGRDLSVLGGNLEGDSVKIDVGRNLNLVTVQNTSSSSSLNATASGTFGAGASGSGSFGMSDAERQWADTVSSIRGNDQVRITVGDTTLLVGSVISADTGNLVLTTPNLVFQDLIDQDKAMSLNVSIGANGGVGGVMGSVGFGYSDSDKQGVTRGTVGTGTIVTSSDISQLNRDLARVQEITQDDSTKVRILVPIVNPDGLAAEAKAMGQAIDKIAQSINDKLLRQRVQDLAAVQLSVGDILNQITDPEQRTEGFEAAGDLVSMLSDVTAMEKAVGDLSRLPPEEQKRLTTALIEGKTPFRNPDGSVLVLNGQIVFTGNPRVTFDGNSLTFSAPSDSVSSPTGGPLEVILPNGEVRQRPGVGALQLLGASKAEFVSSAATWLVRAVVNADTIEASYEIWVGSDGLSFNQQVGLKSFAVVAGVSNVVGAGVNIATLGTAAASMTGSKVVGEEVLVRITAAGISRAEVVATRPVVNVVIRHGPMNPGPLADDIVKTFRSGSYTARTLDQPTILYRVIGDAGNPAGSYWTATRPQGPLQSVIDSALDQNWGNTATTVIRAQVLAGTRIYEGAAAAQRGLVGGGNQIYIPQVNSSWIQP